MMRKEHNRKIPYFYRRLPRLENFREKKREGVDEMPRISTNVGKDKVKDAHIWHERGTKFRSGPRIPTSTERHTVDLKESSFSSNRIKKEKKKKKEGKKHEWQTKVNRSVVPRFPPKHLAPAFNQL